MDGKRRYEDNLRVIHDLTRFRPTDRIPHGSTDAFWRYQDAGYKLSEALFDHKKQTDAVKKFCENYQIDWLLDNGFRNPMQFTSVLGQTQYQFDDENNTLILKEQNHWDPEYYDMYIEDPQKVIWEKILPRKYSRMNKNLTPELLVDTAEAFLNNVNAMSNISKIIAENSGTVGVMENGVNPIFFPMEILFNFWRGFVGTAVDMRRIPEKVDALMDAMWNDSDLDSIKGIDETNGGFSTQITFLAQNSLNAKQFERFEWPHMMKIDQRLRETGGTGFFLSEGTTMHITDLLKDLTPKTYCLYVEKDDITERRKALPEMAMLGGLPIDVLRDYTPDQALDYTKKVIEEVGPSLILSTNKFTCNPKDISPENLKAIGEYLHKDIDF